MKKVEPLRFQARKPDDITFQGSALPAHPPKPAPVPAVSADAGERSNVATDAGTAERNGETAPAPGGPPRERTSMLYILEVPQRRRTVRHSFDVYEDQISHLKKLQLAFAEGSTSRERSLGEMARQALDAFIKAEARRLDNIEIRQAADDLSSS